MYPARISKGTRLSTPSIFFLPIRLSAKENVLMEIKLYKVLRHLFIRFCTS